MQACVRKRVGRAIEGRRNMKHLHVLAEKYQIKLEQFNHLLIASTATPCNINIDVGFGRSDHRKSIIFSHHDIGADVYVYGFGAEELSVRLREINRLAETLRHLFSEYAFAIEWDGRDLTARVNMYYYSPYKDEMLVATLFSELRDVSGYLKSAASSVSFRSESARCKIGPRWVRRATNTAGFLLPFLLMFSFGVVVYTKLKGL